MGLNKLLFNRELHECIEETNKKLNDRDCSISNLVNGFVKCNGKFLVHIDRNCMINPTLKLEKKRDNGKYLYFYALARNEIAYLYYAFDESLLRSYVKHEIIDDNKSRLFFDIDLKPDCVTFIPDNVTSLYEDLIKDCLIESGIDIIPKFCWMKDSYEDKQSYHLVIPNIYTKYRRLHMKALYFKLKKLAHKSGKFSFIKNIDKDLFDSNMIRTSCNLRLCNQRKMLEDGVFRTNNDGSYSKLYLCDFVNFKLDDTIIYGCESFFVNIISKGYQLSLESFIDEEFVKEDTYICKQYFQGMDCTLENKHPKFCKTSLDKTIIDLVEKYAEKLGYQNVEWNEYSAILPHGGKCPIHGKPHNSNRDAIFCNRKGDLIHYCFKHGKSKILKQSVFQDVRTDDEVFNLLRSSKDKLTSIAKNAHFKMCSSIDRVSNIYTWHKFTQDYFNDKFEGNDSLILEASRSVFCQVGTWFYFKDIYKDPSMGWTTKFTKLSDREAKVLFNQAITTKYDKVVDKSGTEKIKKIRYKFSEFYQDYIGYYTVESVGFHPEDQISINTFNTFNGFNWRYLGEYDTDGEFIDENNTKINKILSYIKHIICNIPDNTDNISSNSEDSRVFDYVCDIISCKLKYPGLLIQKAILLLGPYGNGKSTFGNIMCRLIGKYSIKLYNQSLILGDFNGHMENILLTVLDDVKDNKNSNIVQALKSVITETTMQTTKKFENSFKSSNYNLYIAITNDATEYHIDENDRRWLVLEPSSKYAFSASEKLDFDNPTESQIYFKELYSQINNDYSMDILYTYFMNRAMAKLYSVDYFNNNIFITKARSKIIVSTKEDKVRNAIDEGDTRVLNVHKILNELALLPDSNQIKINIVSDFIGSRKQKCYKMIPLMEYINARLPDNIEKFTQVGGSFTTFMKNKMQYSSDEDGYHNRYYWY